MLKGLTFLPSFTLAATMALSTPVMAEPDANTVVARIDGEEITLGHMIVAHAGLPQQYQQLPPDVLYKAILDQLIQQTALKNARNGEVPQHVQISLDNERRSLLAAAELEDTMANAATEEQVRAEYDAKFADGFGGEEFNAAHILVETQEEATAIKAEIEGGADFSETAKEKSTGPSGPNGGALNWFGLGAMVPEFEAAVVTLEAGQVSDPVQTQFGWHLILLNEKRMAKAPTIDEARAELEDSLRQKAVEARIDELTNAATVERVEVEDLNPEILRDLDMIRN